MYRGTALCTRDRRYLGHVAEVIGHVQSPCYIVPVSGPDCGSNACATSYPTVAHFRIKRSCGNALAKPQPVRLRLVVKETNAIAEGDRPVADGGVGEGDGGTGGCGASVHEGEALGGRTAAQVQKAAAQQQEQEGSTPQRGEVGLVGPSAGCDPDSMWHGLPLGDVATVRVELQVDGVAAVRNGADDADDADHGDGDGDGGGCEGGGWVGMEVCCVQRLTRLLDLEEIRATEGRDLQLGNDVSVEAVYLLNRCLATYLRCLGHGYIVGLCAHRFGRLLGD